MERGKSFKLYKGLKKPLVLFGFKGKYIYQAVAFIGVGFVCVAVLTSVIGAFGVLIGGGVAVGGILYVKNRQEKVGVFKKNKTKKEVLIPSKRFREGRKGVYK